MRGTLKENEKRMKGKGKEMKGNGNGNGNERNMEGIRKEHESNMQGSELK